MPETGDENEPEPCSGHEPEQDHDVSSPDGDDDDGFELDVGTRLSISAVGCRVTVESQHPADVVFLLHQALDAIERLRKGVQ